MSQDKPYGLKTLPYPISYQTTLIFPTEGFPLGDASRTSDPTWFTLCLTDEEALQLTSALFAGADLIYPDNSEEIYNIWERSRQFPNQIAPMTCEIEIEVNMTGRIGEIIAWWGDAVPDEAVILAGQKLCPEDAPELFSEGIAETLPGYLASDAACGGDPSVQLPDLRSLFLVGANGGTIPINSEGGQSAITLLPGQLASHSHVISQQRYINWDIEPQAGGNLLPRFENAQAHPVTDTEGDGDLIPTMPPYYAINWIMWVEGEKINTLDSFVQNIFADDCVISAIVDGQNRVVLDVKQCVAQGTGGDAIPGGEETTDKDTKSLDCTWGGVVAMMDYVLDNLRSATEALQSGLDFIEEIFLINPGVISKTAQTLLAVVNEVGLGLLIAELSDPDFREEQYCRAFCYATANFANTLAPTSAEMAGLITDFQVLAPSVGAAVYLMMTAIGAGNMAKRYNLGTDECDNDWLLCDCVEEIVVMVDSEDVLPVTAAGLILGAEYVISWKGTVNWNVNLADALDDGVYRNDGSPGSPLNVYEGRLEWNPGLVWQSIIEASEPRSPKGYQKKFTADASTIDLRFNDPEIDNLGVFTVYIVPVG